MTGDEQVHDRTPDALWSSLGVIVLPEVDEFDLDLRLGELTPWPPGSWLGMPMAAQTDPQCALPTGGQGAGGTCNTQDSTCGATCAGLNTCPATQCGNTCPQTQCNTCNTCPPTQCATCDTCPQTQCDCFTDNQHVNTCHSPCQPR